MAPPRNARVFGTGFKSGVWYLLAPRSASCEGDLYADGNGEDMFATTDPDHAERVTMVISDGGIGRDTDLACPYIPAVRAADIVLRQTEAYCDHPAGEVIQQIPTRTANLYAAVLLVPGSGRFNPTVALFTAQVYPALPAAAAQAITCTLALRDICAASLKFFLVTQARISSQISAAHMREMTATLTSFLAAHYIR